LKRDRELTSETKVGKAREREREKKYGG